LDGGDRDVGEFFLLVVLNALRARSARDARIRAKERGAGGSQEGRGLKLLEPRTSNLRTWFHGYSLSPDPFVGRAGVLIGGVFWWSVRSGQFDDLEGPANRILDDDDKPPLPGLHPRVLRKSCEGGRKIKRKKQRHQNVRDDPKELRKDER
jgi:cbb3-type cytochrome oxidase maturation protein